MGIKRVDAYEIVKGWGKGKKVNGLYKNKRECVFERKIIFGMCLRDLIRWGEVSHSEIEDKGKGWKYKKKHVSL